MCWRLHCWRLLSSVAIANIPDAVSNDADAVSNDTVAYMSSANDAGAYGVSNKAITQRVASTDAYAGANFPGANALTSYNASDADANADADSNAHTAYNASNVSADVNVHSIRANGVGAYGYGCNAYGSVGSANTDNDAVSSNGIPEYTDGDLVAAALAPAKRQTPQSPYQEWASEAATVDAMRMFESVRVEVSAVRRVTGTRTYIEAEFVDGVHQFTDRQHKLTSVPDRLLGSKLFKGPCHHKAGDEIKMVGPPHTTIYIFISDGNSKKIRDALGNTLTSSRGWTYKDVDMSTGSLPNGPSGFRVYEKEAPATATLNKNEGVGGLSIEMSIAMKVQVLTCAAEQQ